MIKRGNVSTWVHEKKTCGWNGNKTPRRRSGRSRHPHPDKHPHTRTKGERERIRTRRKHSAGTKEREREKKSYAVERNKERVLLVILTISFVFFDVWVSRGKDGVFLRQMHSRNFGRKMHLKILGCFFSLFVLCSCSHASSAACFDLICGDGEKKEQATTTREKQKKRLLSFL